MKLKYIILLITAPFVFIVDQLTKWYVVKHVPYYGTIGVIPGYFDITFLRNPGAAFGLFSNMKDDARLIFFYSVAVIAIILLSYLYRQLSEKDHVIALALSLIVGGIAGNITDRIRFGSVTDFLSFHIKDVVLNFSVGKMHFHIPLEWPAFNIADSAISVAMALFIISIFVSRKKYKGV